MIRWQFRLNVVVCCALALMTTWPLNGQIIRGTVVDSATGQPVGTGFVVLLDETGKEVARTLTSAAPAVLKSGHYGRVRSASGLNGLVIGRGSRTSSSSRFDRPSITPLV